MQVHSKPRCAVDGAPPAAPAARAEAVHEGDDREQEQALLAALRIVVTGEPDPGPLAAWDALVAATPETDVAQLSGWAGLRRLAGYEPLYVLAVSGDEVLGGAVVLRRKVAGILRVGYVSYGPVVAHRLTSIRQTVISQLLDALAGVARRHTALFVQPPAHADDVAVELMRRGFRFSQGGIAGIAPAATMRVDLAQDEQRLRGNLSRRLRTWTRQWPQRGVKVRVGNERDIPLLTGLAASTAEYQGFTPFPRSYQESLYAALKPGGHVVLLIGEVSGAPVAAELMTGCGGVLKSRITGLDRTSTEAAKLNVASAMIWEAISWGKAHGFHYFDFGGLHAESVRALTTAENPGDVDQEQLDGPDRFKVKFGGQVFEYPPAVELIGSRVVRFGYDVLGRGSAGRKVLIWMRELLRGGR